MSTRDLIIDGVLRERREDSAVPRAYTAWNASGVIIEGPRAYTAEENAYADALANDQTVKTNTADLLTKAGNAVGTNKTWLGRTSAPTNAQTLDQIDRLTRQVNALIKLRVGDLLDVSGT